MNMRRITLGLSAAVLALGLTACGSQEDPDAKDQPTTGSSDTPSASASPTETEAPIAVTKIDQTLPTIAKGVLTVCSDVPYAPFEDFDKGSKLGFKGFDVDIVDAIAQTYSLDLKIKDSSFDALQSGLSLKAGECDLAASAMTITEDRKKALDFSDPYYDSEQSLLVPQGSDIKGLADLSGKNVGVQKGTTGESYAGEHAGDANIMVFPSDAEMWLALKGGTVDALLQDLPVNVEHTKNDPYEIVEKYSTDESYGLAMVKGSALVAPVNAALSALEDSGRYDQIHASYFGS